MERISNAKENIFVKVREICYLALSFLLPLLLLCILFATNGISLFAYEGKTIIMSDMQSQYIAYLRSYREILLNHGSFIYTTQKAFGGDFMSIYTYYLASPFNLFTVFFQEEALPLFFLWSGIIKMSFASLNFYLLTRITGKFTYQKLISALGYGLISYSLVYFFNFMWLDGVMVLPLIILGLHLLKERRHLYLYPLALAYAIMSSWYIGFMICVFVVFYFFVLFFGDFKIKNIKDNLLFMLRFALFSLLGGALCMMCWFTAYMHLEGTKGVTDLPDWKWFSLSMVLAGFGENHYISSSIINQYNSYISMFVGVVPLVFALTYFATSKYSWKERVAFGLVLLLYLVFSCNSVYNAYLHGGREPTFFPGRYSFVIGFLVCLLASKSLDEAHDLNPLFYLLPIGFGVAALIILNNVPHSERFASYPVNAGSAVMYFLTIAFAIAVSVFKRISIDRPRWHLVERIAPIAMVALLSVEIISIYRGSDNVLHINNETNVYQKYETYLEDCSYDEAFSLVKSYEQDHGASSFYRMEATFNRPGEQNQVNNNPMFYSYAGLSNFSSSSKKQVEQYLSKIGFHYNGFFEKYEGGNTYAMNSFLGMKYLVEDKGNYKNIHPYFLDYDAFKKIDLGTDKVDAYCNPYALSLGFSSDKTNSWFINEGKRLSDSYIYWYDHFEYQNEMFKSLNHSINKNIFSPLEVSSITTLIDFDVDEGGLRTYKNIKKGDMIIYRFSVPTEGLGYPLYFTEKSGQGNIDFFIDGNRYITNNYWHKGIYSFPDNDSHIHTLTIRFQKDFSSLLLRPELYYENLDVSKEYLEATKAQEVQFTKTIDSLSSHGYKGTLDISDNNKHLIFTLPYEKEIHVYVDGNEAETMKKWNIFTAIDLSSYELGKHEISIIYRDEYMRISFPVFLVAAITLIPIVIFYKKGEDALFYREKKEEDEQPSLD